MRTAITLPDSVGKQGRENAKRRGFKHSFSAYVAWLIERDSNGAVLRETLKSDVESVEHQLEDIERHLHQRKQKKPPKL